MNGICCSKQLIRAKHEYKDLKFRRHREFNAARIAQLYVDYENVARENSIRKSMLYCCDILMEANSLLTFLQFHLEGIVGFKFSEEQRENLIKEHIKTYHLTKVGVRSQNATLLLRYDEDRESISAKDTSVEGKISLGTETDEADVEDLDSLWEDGSISSKSMKRLNDEASSAPNRSFFWHQAFDRWLEAILPSEKNIILGKFRDMLDSVLSNHRSLTLNSKHKVYEFKIIPVYRIYFIIIKKNIHIIHAGNKNNQKVFLEHGIHACLSKWISCNSHICK